MRKVFLCTVFLSIPIFLHASSHILQRGERAPSPNFFTPAGDTIKSWEEFDRNIIILDFWTTWCPPCIEAIPKLNQLVEEFSEEPVTFLSITYEPEKMVKPFLRKHNLGTSIGIDNDFVMFRSFKAWGIPMVVLLDADRKVAGVIHTKYLNAEVIREVLNGRVPVVKQHDGWDDAEGAEEYFRSLIETRERVDSNS